MESTSVSQLISSAVYNLVTENVAFSKCIEIDGIICVSPGDQSKDIVIKMHQVFVKPKQSVKPSLRDSILVEKNAEPGPLIINKVGEHTFDVTKVEPTIAKSVKRKKRPKCRQSLGRKKGRYRTVKSMDQVDDDSVIDDACRCGDGTDGDDTLYNGIKIKEEIESEPEIHREYDMTNTSCSINEDNTENDITNNDNMDITGEISDRTIIQNEHENPLEDETKSVMFANVIKTERENTITDDKQITLDTCDEQDDGDANADDDNDDIDNDSDGEDEDWLIEGNQHKVASSSKTDGHPAQNLIVKGPPITSTTTQNKKDKANGVICTICGSVLKNEASCRSHEKTVHGPPNFKCDICFQLFRRKECMDRHKRHSHNIDKIMCSLCGKLFCHRKTLRQHMKSIHIGEKFACVKCSSEGGSDVVFSSQTSYREHMLGVHGPPRYICSKCKKGFKWRNSFKNHKQYCKDLD